MNQTLVQLELLSLVNNGSYAALQTTSTIDKRASTFTLSVKKRLQLALPALLVRSVFLRRAD